MRTDWVSVPFWAIARRVERTGYPDEELLSVYREFGVVRRADRGDNFNRPSEDLSAYKLVRQGDLALNKMKTWQGSLGVSRYRGIVSPAYFVCELSPSVDSRFIHHLLRSRPLIARYEAASKGIRPNQWDLPFDELRQLQLHLPDKGEQRRIADFLDDRVARIDQIIAAREAQQALLKQSLLDSADELFRDEDWSKTSRLGRCLVSIQQGWSPQCESTPADVEQWGVLKVSAVRPGEFREEENKALPGELTPDMSAHVRPGDLLVTRANTPALVGAFAVVPATVRPRLLYSDKIMRLKLSPGVDPRFIALVGQTRAVRDLLSMAGTGTSQSMVNIRGDDIRDLPLPTVPRKRQLELVAAHDGYRVRAKAGQEHLGRQIDLLNEYKQSLITAAVAGEFDVTTASRKIPGE